MCITPIIPFCHHPLCTSSWDHHFFPSASWVLTMNTASTVIYSFLKDEQKDSEEWEDTAMYLMFKRQKKVLKSTSKEQARQRKCLESEADNNTLPYSCQSMCSSCLLKGISLLGTTHSCQVFTQPETWLLSYHTGYSFKTKLPLSKDLLNGHRRVSTHL